MLWSFALQKALTGARKADQKVRKLTQDKATKEAQWRQYGKDMKETYEREHRKFLKDLERIDDDLENVLAQGHDAAELVKRLATHGLTALQRPAPMEEDHSTSTCWEELLSRPAASPEMDDGFLREALQAASQATAATEPWRDIGIANLGSAASLTSVFGSLASGQGGGQGSGVSRPAAPQCVTAAPPSALPEPPLRAFPATLLPAPPTATTPAPQPFTSLPPGLAPMPDPVQRVSAPPVASAGQPVSALATRAEEPPPGRAVAFAEASGGVQVQPGSLPVATDPYQASPSTAVLPSPHGACTSLGPVLAPFRQCQPPVTGQEHTSQAPALPTPHVTGRPQATQAKDRTMLAAAKVAGAPRTPIKQAAKTVLTRPASDAGAKARQQLLEEKRSCPPGDSTDGEIISFPEASGGGSAAVVPDPRRRGGRADCSSQPRVWQDGVAPAGAYQALVCGPFSLCSWAAASDFASFWVLLFCDYAWVCCLHSIWGSPVSCLVTRFAMGRPISMASPLGCFPCNLSDTTPTSYKRPWVGPFFNLLFCRVTRFQPVFYVPAPPLVCVSPSFRRSFSFTRQCKLYAWCCWHCTSAPTRQPLNLRRRGAPLFPNRFGAPFVVLDVPVTTASRPCECAVLRDSSHSTWRGSAPPPWSTCSPSRSRAYKLEANYAALWTQQLSEGVGVRSPSVTASESNSLANPTFGALSETDVVRWLLPFLDSFCRSFCLLQLFAVIHLMLRAVPLRKGCTTSNRYLCRSRSLFRGAPLCLAIALALPFAAGGPLDRPAAAASQPLRPAVSEAASSSHDAARVLGGQPGARRIFGSLFTASLREPVDLEVWQASPRSPPFSRLREDGWETPVQILRYQRAPSYVVLHTAAVRDAEDLAEQAEAHWDLADHGFCCIPVHPQPSLDILVLLAAPCRFPKLQRIPVCVQVLDAHGVVACWSEFFDPTITLAEVKFVFGNQWPPAARVFVRNSSVPLGTAPFSLAAGDLLRVVRPGAPVPEVTTAGAKLVHPELHLRRVSVEGYPTEDRVASRECLLQPLCPVQLLMYSPVPGPSRLQEVVLSHADRNLGEPRLVQPRMRLSDLRVQGFDANRLFGAFPAHVARQAPVFTDGRDVGYPLQLKASYTGTMPLHVFLDTVGLHLPDPDRLWISGSVDFCQDTRQITVIAGDVVVLLYGEDRIGNEV